MLLERQHQDSSRLASVSGYSRNMPRLGIISKAADLQPTKVLKTDTDKMSVVILELTNALSKSADRIYAQNEKITVRRQPCPVFVAYRQL